MAVLSELTLASRSISLETKTGQNTRTFGDKTGIILADVGEGESQATGLCDCKKEMIDSDSELMPRLWRNINVNQQSRFRRARHVMLWKMLDFRSEI